MGAIIPQNYNRLSRPPAGEGSRIWQGRCAKTFTDPGTTYELVMELPGLANQISRLRLITGQSRNDGSQSPVLAQILPISALSDLASSNYAGAYNCTWFSNSATYLVPSPSSSRRQYQISDPIPGFIPVARSDGGTRPLVSVRVYALGANVNYMGNGTQYFSNWATRTAGLVRLRSNSTTGSSQITTTTGWSTSNWGPALGFVYGAENPTYQVASFGDSIYEGQGTYIGGSFCLQATEAQNLAGGRTLFSYNNCSWSGQSTSQFLQNIIDTTTAGIVPDIAILPCGSPNDVGNTSITSTMINLMRSNLISMLDVCAINNITPIVCTWMPTNSSVNNYGSSDSLRVAYNAEILSTMAANGIITADVNLPMSGVTTGGQVQMTVGYTTDNIHPNDAGNLACVPYVQTALQQAVGGYA